MNSTNNKKNLSNHASEFERRKESSKITQFPLADLNGIKVEENRR